MAYGSEIDLTPRAFALQEPPPSTEPVVQVIAAIPSRRARPWRQRAVIAAVAVSAIAGAAVAVTRTGMLQSGAAPKAAAPAVELKPSVPAIAAPKPISATAPAEATAPKRDAVPSTPVEAALAAPAPSATTVEPILAATAPPAPVEATPAIAPATATNAARLPSYVSEPGVLFLTRVAVQRAERTCHRRGRAVGKAQVFVTFAPNGRAVEARVEGEPIASAPVARCIKDQLFSVVIPKFDGAAFTVSEPITLY
jgi:hypothetical protein